WIVKGEIKESCCTARLLTVANPRDRSHRVASLARRSSLAAWPKRLVATACWRSSWMQLWSRHGPRLATLEVPWDHQPRELVLSSRKGQSPAAPGVLHDALIEGAVE